MRPVHTGPVVGFACLLALLGALAASVGLGGGGWAVGLGCGVVTSAVLARGLARCGADGLGPADRVTLARAVLAGGVAALTADSYSRPVPVAVLVALSAVALVLDAVDGWAARRTGTVSALGARFDMEVDAFLVLALSVFVAPTTGWWVLAIGAARYLLLVAGRAFPWLRGRLPPRYWAKVVAAVQGVVLTVAAAGVLPRGWTEAALGVALVLLTESFGRQVWGLWRARAGSRPGAVDPVAAVAAGDGEPSTGRGRLRGSVYGATTVLACLAVWAALVLPDEPGRLTPAAFARVPLEGLLLVAVGLVLRPRGRRTAAGLLGAVLGLLVLVKVLDMGFLAVLDRPFDPLDDWAYLGPALGVLGDSVGRAAARATVVGAVFVVVAVLVLMALSVARLTGLVAGHRRASLRVGTALVLVWVLAAVSGLETAPGSGVASTSAAALAYDEVRQVGTDIHDRRAFTQSLAVDPYRLTPRDELLSGLRGKDVVLAFVESYGRVAVQGSSFSPRVDSVLEAGTRQLRAAGFASRSAFLTSPTFGGASWLAHSTLQSGLWVDSQERYDRLVGADRLTLTDAFGRAGWRTVFDVPSNIRDWPEGAAFYHFDKLYDDRNVGYRGPRFAYATMPDQYTLSALRRLELARQNRPPIMAEVDLVTSHHPWTPLPRMVPWSQVGDGSVFDGMPEQGEPARVAFRDPGEVRALYGRSIRYSLRTLVSYVRTFPDPDLVLVLLGDHQPHTYVTGDGVRASHDVPVTIVAHDPAVMRQISGWGWQEGMRPGPGAPVWRMDAFRDRFLTAFGPHPRRAVSSR